MRTFHRISGMVVIVVLAMVAAAGCQTDQGTVSATGESAIACSKCETTWVQRPQASGKSTVFVSSKEMKCPDCESAAANFLKTGKLAHTCKHCGETLAHCESHTKTYEGAAAVKESAITCPKCEITWVKQPQQVNAGRTTVTVYKNVKKMACPDCETAAATYFKTGALNHTCKSCGTTMQHCKEH